MTAEKLTLPSVEVAVVIPFHDVDLMEVAWHGHYAKYFEIARSALLDTISYNYKEMRESGFSWPIIEMKIRYAQPARFGQCVTVTAYFIEYELRLKIGYLIADQESGKRLTKAYTIQAAVRMETQELMLSSPPILLEKFGVIDCD